MKLNYACTVKRFYEQNIFYLLYKLTWFTMNVKSQPKVMNFIFSSFEGNKCHLDKTKYKEKIM
jgi:hypothetical protein